MYQQRCCHILVFIERNRIALGVQRFPMGANVICFTYHHQAPSHYLSQCWPRSLSQYGVTRPQWINMYLYTVCALLCFVVVRYLSFEPISSWITLTDNKMALLIDVSAEMLFVRRAGLLWSQQDFEWRWSVPLFKCLTVLEFSFILFDLCILITFFNFIMNYVPIVTFWIFTYHKIWILSIMFCFIWSYWIIYFLACLEVSWRVVS